MVPHLNLLCSTNASLLFAAATLIYSVRTTLSPASRLNVCCYVDDVLNSDQEKLKNFCNGLGNCSIRLITFDDLASEARRQLLDISMNRPPNWRSAFARLFLIDALDRHMERILYTDVDIVALQDISEASSLDLGGSAIGAVESPLKLFRGRVGAARYLNSGVLLIESNRWLAEEITQKCVFWMQQYGRQRAMADQDALNIAFQARDGSPTWHPLETAWNALPPLYLGQDDINYDPVPIETVKLLHYAGTEKPWKTRTHPHGHYYHEYARHVPFRPGKHGGGLYG